MDIVLAMNFSYWILHTRTGMRRYFEKVRDALVEDGVFFLDAYGGYDAFREMRETTGNDGFTYVWDQARYDPITGRQRCHIHFRFPDGSRIKDAFVYEWRLWTLPEIREILEEAGFRDVTVYWQGTRQADRRRERRVHAGRARRGGRRLDYLHLRHEVASCGSSSR